MKKGIFVAALIPFACGCAMFVLRSSNLSKANEAESRAVSYALQGEYNLAGVERNNANQYRSNANINLTCGISTMALGVATMAFSFVKKKEKK